MLRRALTLLLMGVIAGTAQAAAVPRTTAFPVIGNVTYVNDFGAPRPGGRHMGNDIMSVRHQPAVAFEAGRIHKMPGSGGCMLELHGKSGMVYWYIHLNNDLGATNDNKGRCRNGVAYAPGLKEGQYVRLGQLVAFVGDSGDANGIQPHLHFEIHRPSGRRLNPYTYLNRARHLLYPRLAANTPIALSLNKARVLATDTGNGTLTVRTKRIRILPSGPGYPFGRGVLLSATGTTFQRVTSTGQRSAISLANLHAGMVVWVGTTQFAPSWSTQRAAAGVLAAAKVTLR